MNRHLAIFFLFAVSVLAVQPATAQWVNVNGVGGASVTSFAQTKAGIFAGTNAGVIFSSDGGASWSTVDSGLTDSNVTAVFAKDTTILVGARPGAVIAGKLYRWNRSLKRWQESIAFPSASAFAELGPFIFAISNQALAVSVDKGITWRVDDTSFRDLSLLSLTPLSTELFAGTGNGVVISLDFGATWESPQALLGNHVSALASIGNTLLAGNSNEYDTVHPNGIYRSTDFGNSWTLVFQAPIIAISSFYTADSVIYAATDQGVLRSSDLGVHWKFSSAGIENLNVQALAGSGNELFAGSKGSGTFLSRDTGTSWTSSNTGLTGTYIRSLYKNGNVLFAGGDNYAYNYFSPGVLHSTDEGDSWRCVSPEPSVQDVIDYAIGFGNLMMSTNVGIFSTNNNGDAWDLFSDSLSQFGIMKIIQVGSQIFIGTNGEGIFKSTDSGRNWIAANNGIPAFSRVFDFAVDGNTILVASYNGVFRSTDDGLSWQKSNNGIGDTDVLFLGDVGGTLFAGDLNGYGLYRSKDNGKNWETVNIGLPDRPWPYSLAVDGSNIFVALEGGVYLSTDLGDSWSPENDGLESGSSAPYVDNLAIDSTYLFATSFSEGNNSINGVWRRPLSEMIPTSYVTTPPASSSDMWNYPNPFSESTTITFTTKLPGDASVSIMNMLGEEVARVYNGMLSAGKHSLIWNKPDNVPTGAYECRVVISGKEQTLPIIVTP